LQKRKVNRCSFGAGNNFRFCLCHAVETMHQYNQ
jgi:hypothetical protein